MNSLVIKYLQEKGFKNIANDYYDYVSLWEKYWKNDVDYMTYYDDYKNSHRLYTLGMAKRVCEDWASVICSEQDEVKTDKKKKNSKGIKT